MINDRQNTCRRCGVCCEKGGPSLHRTDRPLVDNGQLPARYLFTIRRGELVRDDIKGTLAPLEQEIIKIKGRAPAWTCRFYDKEKRGCRIYSHRPLECRVLNCRDTRRIEKVYAAERLTRRDLLSEIQGLWELIEDHERRCGYDTLHAWVGEGTRAGVLVQEDALLELLRFDAQVRKLTVEKGGMDAQMLDFLFGRPLADTIRMFDIGLVNQNGGVGLAPMPTLSRRPIE
jgi:Fe-S-cluster containining protein